MLCRLAIAGRRVRPTAKKSGLTSGNHSDHHFRRVRRAVHLVERFAHRRQLIRGKSCGHIAPFGAISRQGPPVQACLSSSRSEVQRSSNPKAGRLVRERARGQRVFGCPEVDEGVAEKRREGGSDSGGGGRLDSRFEMGAAGSELDESSHCPGAVAGLHWHCAGTALALRWHWTGTALVPHWHSTDNRPGAALALHWCRTRTAHAYRASLVPMGHPLLYSCTLADMKV